MAIVITPEALVAHPGVAFVAASYSCSVEQMNPTKIGAGHRHGAFLSAIAISLGGEGGARDGAGGGERDRDRTEIETGTEK